MHYLISAEGYFLVDGRDIATLSVTAQPIGQRKPAMLYTVCCRELLAV